MNDAALIVVQFAPFLGLTVLANMAAGHPLFRRLTDGMLIGILGLIVLAGASTTLSVLLAQAGLMEPVGSDSLFALSPWPGVGLVATGIIGLAMLWLPVREFLARFIPIDPASAVHATALVFATLLVGLLGIVQLFAGPAAFQGASITPALLWTQALSFVCFGLLGVGLGLRRDWRETLHRLGLGGLSPRQVLLAVGVVVGLLLFDLLISTLWRWLDPQSLQTLDTTMRGLLEGLLSPVGIVSLSLSAGLGEEILFRGALQPRFGLVLSSLLFAAGHAQYSIGPALLEIFVIGLVLGLIRQRENTTTAIAAHALYNLMTVVLPSVWG